MPATDEPLGIPFVSESYDRLMAQQAKHREASAALDRRPDPIREVLTTPVDSGPALRLAREHLSLSQAMLGEAIGLDAPRISQMENGKPIDRRTDLAVRALLAGAIL